MLEAAPPVRQLASTSSAQPLFAQLLTTDSSDLYVETSTSHMSLSA